VAWHGKAFIYLGQTPSTRKSVSKSAVYSAAAARSDRTVHERLLELNTLRDAKLITDLEFSEKRVQILADL